MKATPRDREGPDVPDDGKYRASVVAALLAAHEQETTRAGWLAKLRRSRWAAPASKVLGLLLGLVALSLIGLWADPRPRTAEAAAAPEPSPSATPPALSASSPPPASDPPKVDAPAPEAALPTGVLPDGRIVLNLATEDELTKLPHVGTKRAKEIVTLRTRLGRFRAITDLLRVRGLGRKTLGKIAPKVVLDPPKDAPAPPA